MLIGGFGYICPGPLTTVEIIGIAGVAASTAEQASSANSTTAAEILIALSLHLPPTTYHLPTNNSATNPSAAPSRFPPSGRMDTASRSRQSTPRRRRVVRGRTPADRRRTASTSAPG